MATHEIIETAIDRSISQDEIVWIDSDDIRQAGLTTESVCEALAAECEDSSGPSRSASGGATIHEYWGEDCDGRPWRVHVLG